MITEIRSSDLHPASVRAEPLVRAVPAGVASAPTSLSTASANQDSCFCKVLRVVGNCFKTLLRCIGKLCCIRVERTVRSTPPLLVTPAVQPTPEVATPAVRAPFTPEQVAETDREGQTRLHRACRNGDLVPAGRLLQAGASVLAVDREGFTPLLRACENAISGGTLGLVRLFLLAGADARATDAHQNNALHLLLRNRGVFTPNCTELIRELIRAGTPTDAFNDEGRTPFYYLCEMEHRGLGALVDAWVEAGGTLAAVDRNGSLPLHVACQLGVPPIVEGLIRAGVDIEVPDALGRTPLHLAARHQGRLIGQVDTIRVLLDAGAQINALDNHLSTPLHHACSIMLNERIVRELIQRGANLQAQDRSGWTPYHVAFASGSGLCTSSAGVFDTDTVCEAVNQVPLHELMRGNQHPACAHYLS